MRSPEGLALEGSISYRVLVADDVIIRTYLWNSGRYYRRKLRNLLVAGFASLVFSAVGSAGIVWTLSPVGDGFEPDEVGVEIVVSQTSAQADAKQLQIDATVIEGLLYIGDLRGIFFNVVGVTMPATGPVPFAGLVTSADADITAVCTGTGILQCTGSNNVNGLPNDVSDLPTGSFHVGIEFGSPGQSAGDVRSATILFNYGLLGPSVVLTPESFGPFAARLMSVGVEGTKRNLSAKLYAEEGFPEGGGEVDPIPEPSTWLLMSAGLGLLAFARRRRAA